MSTVPSSTAAAPEASAAAPARTWTSATLGSLAYCLFAIQQPGPVSELRTREETEADGLLSPVASDTAPGPESDQYLRRQSLLGELSQLDL